MASNLPPGVTDSMLPGNRPEDIWFENFVDALYEKIDEVKVKFGADNLALKDGLMAIVDDIGG